MLFKYEEISEIIKDRLIKYNLDFYCEGKIISIIDGVIKITGLSQVFINEIIELPYKIGYALVFDLDRYHVNAISLNFSYDLKVGMKVKSTGQVLKVPVGKNMLGRVVNFLAEPIDGLKEIIADNYYPIEKESPLIVDRRHINRPLCTGYKSIDSMIPIGLGQRELIIGDRKTGKTSLAIDIIINQRLNNVKCVYVSIGQKISSVFNIVKKLKFYNSLDHTVVVSSSSSELAIMQYICAYTGCSIAEYFRNQGEDVLIVYDDLSKHAVAYRQICLLLRRFPGREAYPGDIFYIHSRLLERSAYVNHTFISKYNESYKLNELSGSLTSLPIVETYEGDISSFIPTNIISITDGQIYLETDLFNSGIKPAINPGISVSRVGSSAQTKIMKRLTSSLRNILSQYYELLNFSQFSNDLDKETKLSLCLGKKIIEILKQDQYSSISLFNQVLIFFSLNNGYLDKINLDKIHLYEKELYKYANNIKNDSKYIFDLYGDYNDKVHFILSEIVSSFNLIFN